MAVSSLIRYSVGNRDRIRGFKSLFIHKPIDYYLETELGRFRCVDIASAIQFSRRWEPRIKEQVREVRDGLFVDVGANIGYYSVIAAQNRNTVIAIEPNKSVRECLDFNLKSYQMSRIIPFAAWSKREVLHIRSPGYTDISRISDLGDSIIGVPLDEVLAEYQTPTLVKIDVEGVEAQILQGMRKTLERGPKLVMEIWNPSKFERVFSILSPLGYSLFRLDSVNFLAVRIGR